MQVSVYEIKGAFWGGSQSMKLIYPKKSLLIFTMYNSPVFALLHLQANILNLKPILDSSF